MEQNALLFRFKSVLCAMALALGVGGCATSANPKDPVEGFNRAMFAFNDGLDTVFIKPLAQGYDEYMPMPVRTGITNFFGNLADVYVGVNSLLQGKAGDALSDFGRVLINSTVGIFGVFDVATEAGLEKHEEDFGQTLGRWGVGTGPYLVLPVFGPRTLRDTAGLMLDMSVDPVSQVDYVSTRNQLTILRLIDMRADLLPADKVIDAAALDKYTYIRDGYLQRRRSLIYDGNPPRELED